MKYLKFLCAIAFVVFQQDIAVANNTYFLPSDAFFFARLDKASVEKIFSSDSPVLSYGNHWDGGFGCGHVGYSKFRLTEMHRSTKLALLEAFMHFAPNIEDVPNQDKKISVFIYSKEYDWKTYGLGLQYNESWVDESVKFGAQREHVRLESFVKKPSSIMRNWRDSTRVAPMQVTCPELPKSHEQAWTKTPVKAHASKCRLIVIPNRNFDDFVQPSDGLEMITIVQGKLNRYLRDNGEWLVQP